MDSMTYKGYLATVHYSHEDQTFFGKVHGINDLITFEADSAKALAAEFHKAVDDYLRTCKKLGREPDKTFNGVFNVRTGRELHRKAALLAEKYHVSLNDLVKNALAYGLEHEDELANNFLQEKKATYQKNKKK